MHIAYLFLMINYIYFAYFNSQLHFKNNQLHLIVSNNPLFRHPFYLVLNHVIKFYVPKSQFVFQKKKLCERTRDALFDRLSVLDF